MKGRVLDDTCHPADPNPAAYPLRFLGGAPDDSAGYRTPQIHLRGSERI